VDDVDAVDDGKHGVSDVEIEEYKRGCKYSMLVVRAAQSRV